MSIENEVSDADETFVPSAENLPPAGQSQASTSGPMFAPSVYNMRCDEAVIGKTKDGNPQVGLLMIFTDGPYKGMGMTFYGHFTDKTDANTIRALRTLGWQGDDLRDLSSVIGGEAPCTIQTKAAYGDRGPSSEIRFIGAPSVGIKEVMPDNELDGFALRMKALASKIPAAKPQVKPAGQSENGTKKYAF